MELMTPEHKEVTVKHTKRWGGWWLGNCVLIAMIGAYANQQLPVMAYKVALVCMAMPLAYWFYRTLYSNAPEIHCDMPRDSVSAALLLARAIIAGAVVIAITLAL